MESEIVYRYCGNCGRKQNLKRRRDGLLTCPECGGLFDDDPDEHGYAIHRDPVRAAQSKEEFEARRRQRRHQQNYPRGNR